MKHKTFEFSGYRNLMFPWLKALNLLRIAITRFIHHRRDDKLVSCVSTLTVS